MSQYNITAKTQSVTNARTKVNQIIRYLKDNRGPHSFNKIRMKTRIDLKAPENLTVLQSLKQNKKVLPSGSTFEYQVSYSIHNQSKNECHFVFHPIPY